MYVDGPGRSRHVKVPLAMILCEALGISSFSLKIGELRELVRRPQKKRVRIGAGGEY